MESTAFLYTFNNHTSQRADFAIGELFNDFLGAVKTSDDAQLSALAQALLA